MASPRRAAAGIGRDLGRRSSAVAVPISGLEVKPNPDNRNYLPKIDLRMYRPAAVVAVPRRCLAYSTLRTALGVARRLIEPAVLRTGCIARLIGLGRSPLRKLTTTSHPDTHGYQGYSVVDPLCRWPELRTRTVLGSVRPRTCWCCPP